MKGITGDLDENWGSVGAYADWIGGTDTSWERPPYWLDGLVPLSYLLHDEKGMEKAEKWVRWSLDSQRENGDFGPTYNRTDFDSTLFWPKFVMLKVMVSYYEVRPQQEILDFMTKYFRFCLRILDTYEPVSYTHLPQPLCPVEAHRSSCLPLPEYFRSAPSSASGRVRNAEKKMPGQPQTTHVRHL